MLTIILSGCILAALLNLAEYKSGTKEYLKVSLLSLLFGGMLGFFISLALPRKTYFEYTKYQLKPFSENSYVLKTRCNGISYVSVLYSINNKDTLENIDPNTVEIQFNDSIPVLEKYIEHSVKGAFINLFAIDAAWNDKNVINIPVNSVNKDLILTLK